MSLEQIVERGISFLMSIPYRKSWAGFGTELSVKLYCLQIACTSHSHRETWTFGKLAEGYLDHWGLPSNQDVWTEWVYPLNVLKHLARYWCFETLKAQGWPSYGDMACCHSRNELFWPLPCMCPNWARRQCSSFSSLPVTCQISTM